MYKYHNNDLIVFNKKEQVKFKKYKDRIEKVVKKLIFEIDNSDFEPIQKKFLYRQLKRTVFNNSPMR